MFNFAISVNTRKLFWTPAKDGDEFRLIDVTEDAVIIGAKYVLFISFPFTVINACQLSNLKSNMTGGAFFDLQRSLKIGLHSDYPQFR